MLHDLQAVAYASRSAIADDRATALASIVAAAERANRAEGVSGALLCSPSHFAQILEGPVAAVETVFERIQRDPRHCEIQALYATPIRARAFAGWGMASAGLLDSDAALDALLAQGAAARASADGGPQGQQALAVLRRLLLDRLAV